MQVLPAAVELEGAGAGLGAKELLLLLCILLKESVEGPVA
jgi:hypothetical protein